VKKFILALVLASTSVFAQKAPDFSEVKKPVICSDTDFILAEINKSEFKEKAVWLGTDDKKHRFVLFLNLATGTWTILEFKDNIACFLGSGDKSEFSKQTK